MIPWRMIFQSTLVYAVLTVVINKIISNEFGYNTILQGIVTGLVVSVVFFTFFPRMAKYTTKKLGASIPGVELDEGESLHFKGGANHFKGIEGVGGMLTLTNKRLVFRSHKFNIQNHQQVFGLNEIKDLSLDGRKIFYKVFKMTLLNNETHKFVVDDPSSWIEKIRLQQQTMAS